MDLGIEGRAAIVTGGSRGIGRETARKPLLERVMAGAIVDWLGWKRPAAA